MYACMRALIYVREGIENTDRQAHMLIHLINNPESHNGQGESGRNVEVASLDMLWTWASGLNKESGLIVSDLN